MMILKRFGKFLNVFGIEEMSLKIAENSCIIFSLVCLYIYNKFTNML